MPATTLSASEKLAADIQKLSEQKVTAQQNHAKSLSELDQKIEQLTSQQAIAQEKEAAIAREKLATESFKKLRDEAANELNQAAKVYAAALRKFADLTPHTRSKFSSMGSYSGEINTHVNTLKADRLPLALVSEDGSRVYLAINAAEAREDAARFGKLREEILGQGT